MWLSLNRGVSSNIFSLFFFQNFYETKHFICETVGWPLPAPPLPPSASYCLIRTDIRPRLARSAGESHALISAALVFTIR